MDKALGHFTPRETLMQNALVQRMGRLISNIGMDAEISDSDYAVQLQKAEPGLCMSVMAADDSGKATHTLLTLENWLRASSKKYVVGATVQVEDKKIIFTTKSAAQMNEVIGVLERPFVTLSQAMSA